MVQRFVRLCVRSDWELIEEERAGSAEYVDEITFA